MMHMCIISRHVHDACACILMYMSHVCIITRNIYNPCVYHRVYYHHLVHVPRSNPLFVSIVTDLMAGR